MNEKTFYDEDYFENGLVSKKSCYENYRWMPELTIPMADKIARYLNLTYDQNILDFGCSKGYLVKAFRLLNFQSYGVDISNYAINRIEPDIVSYCKLINDDNIVPFDLHFDYVMSKDVLEHMTIENLKALLSQYKENCKKMFHVIPLGEEGKFRIDEYHLDKSHIQIHSENWWINFFDDNGWEVEDFLYQVKGIKDKWIKSHEKGNGFFTLKKK